MSVVRAGLYSGDLCHPLVYAPELFKAEFKSEVADMKNSVKVCLFVLPMRYDLAIEIPAQCTAGREVKGGRAGEGGSGAESGRERRAPTCRHTYA